MKTPVPPLPLREEFRGRVALITGGTSGLGRHLAATMIELGCEVFFCGRKAALGQQLATEWGSRAHFACLDLADVQTTRAFVEAAGNEFGRLDYVVNNAAIDPVAPIMLSMMEDFDRVVAVNLRSYFAVAQASLPFLKKGSGRAIVNLGTTNWMLGEANHTMYASAKAGVLGLSRSLAREFGPLGIRVNMVSPGWIMTERQLKEKVTARDREQLLHDTAIGTLLGEAHVTPATLFLLSAAALGITGQNLVVDGGKYMQ